MRKGKDEEKNDDDFKSIGFVAGICICRDSCSPHRNAGYSNIPGGDVYRSGSVMV